MSWVSDLEFDVVAHATTGELEWDYYPVIRMRYQVDADATGSLISRTVDIWKGAATHAYSYQAINHGVEVLAKSLHLILATAEHALLTTAKQVKAGSF